jgi:hypothetical protein
MVKNQTRRLLSKIISTLLTTGEDFSASEQGNSKEDLTANDIGEIQPPAPDMKAEELAYAVREGSRKLQALSSEVE